MSAVNVKRKYDEYFDEVIARNSELFKKNNKKCEIEILHGDFLDYNWSKVSVVFANSTCFSMELMEKLSKKAGELKEGSFFVTFTNELQNLSGRWIVKNGFKRIMSWGIATIYVHYKIR